MTRDHKERGVWESCSWEGDEERSSVLLLRSPQVVLVPWTAVFSGINWFGQGELYWGINNSSIGISGSKMSPHYALAETHQGATWVFPSFTADFPFRKFAFMQLYNIQSKPVLVFPSHVYRLQNTPFKSCLNFIFSIMLHFLLPCFLRGFIRKLRGFLLHSLEFAEYFPAVWK